MPNPLDDVTQDLRDDDGNPLRRVYVNGAGQPTDTGDVFQPAATNRLTQAVAPAQQQYDLPTLIAQVKAYLTDPTGFSGGTKVGNRLFGTGGEERYQTWPEKMIRSGATLAGDEMAGGAGLANMGLRREDVTDIPKPGGLTVAAQPGDETRERAMDMAGLAGGGALTERPGVATLGSGPVRPAMKESLTPAVKWDGRIYKGKVGDEHVDIVPEGLQKYLDKNGLDLETAAADDLLPDGYRTGFVDHKGRFLNHTQAAEYAATAPDLVHPDYQEYVKEHGPNKRGVLTSDMLWSDTQKPGAAVSAAASSGPAPVFYSALEHATTNAAQDTMAPQQWLGYLKNQPGVKAEELAWTGLPEWLAGQKGKIKKQDVQAYLDEHKVEIKDVTKGGPQATDLITDDVHDLGVQAVLDAFLADNPKWVGKEHTAAFERAHERFAESERGEQIYNDAQQQVLEPEGSTKYSSYQLPGGENYREHLLTLSYKPKTELPKGWSVGPSEHVPEQFSVKNEKGEQVGPNYDTPERAMEKHNLYEGGQDYKSSHWDEPNVLAHVRINDRVIGETPISEIEAKIAAAVPGTKLENMASGIPSKLVREGVITPQEAADWSRARGFRNNGFEDKPGTGQKSLHIEEIQSDWHQQGRKQGYRPPNPEVTPELKDISARVEPSNRAARSTDPAYWAGAPSWVADAVKAGRITQAEADQLKAYNDAWTMKGVPDAPFKTTWPELALKRMIRHAAENGYDRISWTPGEAQAARYDLSKSIKALQYQLNKDGKTYTLMGETDRGGTHAFGNDIPTEKLADFVGKDVAQKIIDDKNNVGVLKGPDLKVGGEGMREFYDKMLPKMAEKIGKAHGVKVKQTNLPADRRVFEDKTNKEFPWHAEDDKGTGRAFKTEKEAREWAKQGPPVHYFDLPQSLKDHAIGKGFPLYMSGLPFPLKPVDHDPFEKKE